MDNCCLYVYGIGVLNKDVVFESNSVLNGEYNDFYFETQYGALYISYDEQELLWSLKDGEAILASSEFSGDMNCFSGLQFSFNDGGDQHPTYTFTVYKVPCDFTPTLPTIEYPIECLQEACRNKNLFNKHKRMLAEDIAGISKKEIFGFKCGDAWENIFMRNMIIHALSCMPTGVLSIEKEKCLIGKLTDKCNC